ncbi:U4/U6.U5 tri-snRNP component SNU23 [Metschnikowia aff. pulcherrima]|uniref:U4/U6.U5 tri-snRNP component SNU23 n=1 Tax=Metschnikowia aff. pulcherrima TaxID=2163413 RepID=A0A4P6XR80_9ASCO|nr:U4/U6.U5 tri-snRNP component SNU23 [Metschnikowia aff. pulcherrima]
MSEKTSTDQYGRKQWDVEAYAAEAQHGSKNQSKTRENDALKRKLKLQTFVDHRADLLGQAVDAVGKHTLVGGEKTTLTYGRNKRFGFSCPTCDLSFRDTLALVDHLNSPQHLHNVQKLLGKDFGTGEELEGGVRRASKAQVLQTIEELVKRLLREKSTQDDVLSLQERVRRRLEFEKKKAQRRRERKKKNVVSEEVETEMGKLMGFEGFGSTKSG